MSNIMFVMKRAAGGLATVMDNMDSCISQNKNRFHIIDTALKHKDKRQKKNFIFYQSKRLWWVSHIIS